MWEIGFLIPTVLFLPLVVYRIRHKEMVRLVHKLVPQRVQRYLENLILKDYASVYGFTVSFVVLTIIIAWSAVVNVVLGYQTLSPEEAKRYAVLISSVAVAIVYVGLFFNQYSNEMVWRQSKRDRNLGLFAVQFLVETGLRLGRIGISLCTFSSYPLILLAVGARVALPQVLNTFLIYTMSLVLSVGICCIAIGGMLELDKSNTEVTIRLLEWFRDFKPDQNRMNDSVLLPRVIDYSRQEMKEDLGFEDLDLKKPFELLCLTRKCGDDSERHEVSDTIANLIKALKAKESRRFIEILHNTKENHALSTLNDMMNSTKMSFFRRKRRPQKLATIAAVVLFVFDVIQTIIIVLSYLGVHLFG